MALNALKNEWLHKFKLLDSTNNYAMKLIDDGLAQNGTAVWALEQSAGKGQRGKQWLGEAGQNLMMSLIVVPTAPLMRNPFLINLLVPSVVVVYLQRIAAIESMSIKWPNDIYIDDKKTAGILIENTFRGMQWTFSVIGIGVNVNQTEFSTSLPNPTSLKLATGIEHDIEELLMNIRAGLLNRISALDQQREEDLLAIYNARLYNKGKNQKFRDLNTDTSFYGQILGVNKVGELLLSVNNEQKDFSFGSLAWLQNEA